MSRKTFEEKIEEMVAEEQTAVEQQAEETQTEETAVEEQPSEEVSENDTEQVTETQQEPKKEPDPDEHKTEAIDEIENTNSIIRRRLEKQAEKFEKEKEAMKADFEARLKALEEKAQPKPETKTRDSFKTDEEYVAWLTRQQIDADRAEQQKLKDEKDAEDAKAKAEKDAADEVIKQRQQLFLSNVDGCFEGEDKEKFMAQVQYATKKGLGDLLDACPVASDYLLNSRKGPKVLSKLLNDREAFLRVFDPKGISPMEQYYELKELEKSLETVKAEEVKAPPPAATAPKIGKPGAQGGSASVDPLGDPKARRDYMRKVMGY